MPNPLNPARAQRHAALTPRLAALAGQLQALALRKPGEPVSATVQSLAEDLLFGAREFRPPGERRGLPAAAPDHAGLAAQLGQALAMLALWQARHPAPVVRPTSSANHTAAEIETMRHKLAKRLDQLVAKRLNATRPSDRITSEKRSEMEIYPRSGAPG